MFKAKMGTITFCCEIKHKTDMAYFCLDGDNELWIPISQIEDEILIESENEKLGTPDIWELTIPEWLAIEKGIV